MSLYMDLLDAGVKMSNHYSDLYFERNDVSKEIVKNNNIKVSIFDNKVEKCFWFCAPFQYEPYWEAKSRR